MKEHISTAELRKLTGYSDSAVAEMKARGHIVSAATGKWEPVSTLAAMVRKLREKDAGATDRQRRNKAAADKEEALALRARSEVCLMSAAKVFASETRIMLRQCIERSDLTAAQKKKLLEQVAKVKVELPEAE